MNGTSAKTIVPEDIKMKNGNGTISDNNNDLSALITAKIKDDFLDAKQGPDSGLLSKLKSNLVDVIVCNAVGPHNFCIQDYRQSENLKMLEKNMTDFYTEYAKIKPPMNHKEVKLEGFYAAKLASKGHWVRVQVVKPFSSEKPQIMVYLLDHGSFEMTDAAQLRYLRRPYVEKLPSQAYRAKLHFLGAAGNLWEPEACNRFQKDVEGKPFCAIIVEESKDDLLQGQPIIFSLVLIDTSGPQDRYVHQSYIKRGR
ncbi:Tudor domain-containing protein 7 [Orchesella cincta]|uniref:Tudor domain-containing protein 7 n=1 Tax=Orchesella cincta TaxID=48709 RepID=A0A1D2NGS8_ORCCI|nr:Tudor domain-containing protein 7 [Orchesella cincta]